MYIWLANASIGIIKSCKENLTSGHTTCKDPYPIVHKCSSIRLIRNRPFQPCRQVQLPMQTVDPDETAYKESSRQDSHWLSVFWLRPSFAIINVSKFGDERVHFRNSGMKRLKELFETGRAKYPGENKSGYSAYFRRQFCLMLSV